MEGLGVDLAQIAETLRFLAGPDPAAQETVTLVGEIIDLEQRKAAEKGAPAGSLRLQDLRPYLKSYLFIRKNPWIVPVGVGLLIAGVLYVGSMIGRRT